LAKKNRFTKIQELIYELKVKEVMTIKVISVDPDMKMSKLRDIFRQNRISGAPVVQNGELLGLISLEDFINWLAEGQKDYLIADKMTGKVETVFEDSTLVEAVSKFDKYNYGRFPVIARKSKRLTGFLTKGDIIEGLLKKLEVEYHEEEIHAYRASHIFEDIVADKIILRFQYWIKGKDFNHAGECASRLKKTLKRLGFKPDIIRKAAIAAYEAEMNIIIYTDKGEIIADVEPYKLKIKAQDKGPGIKNIKKAMQPGYSTASDWVRELGFGAGMGLTNIEKCSDKMSISSTKGKGTQLEIDINLNYRKS